MAGDHSHGGPPLGAGARYRRRLTISFFLLAVFFGAEVVTGLLTNSLALLSDAGHMLTDVAGVGMAVAAIHVSGRARTDGQRTFGLYRLEVLAALANSVLLVGVAVYVIVEAVRRLGEPPDVVGAPLLVVASLGLAVNLGVFFMLREGAKESMNVQGAYLEVLADTVGSIGVMVAAVVLLTTGWAYVDPIVAVAIGLFILPRTFRLARQALRVLLQSAPPGVEIESLREDLGSVPGVVDVHDIHVWTLTSDMEVASAHLRVSDETDAHRVLDRARQLLHDRYRIAHATLQVEPSGHRGCEELRW